MGHFSGSIGGVSLATLGRLDVRPDRRLAHVVTAIGDSRVAAIRLDPAGFVAGATSPLNWANAVLGQRLVIGETFGVSGDRTDQMLARLPVALATGAGLLYVQGGLNDIAQTHPTAATSGASAFANIRTMAEAGRKAGMTVVIEAEVGADSIQTTALTAQVEELNARLYEYAERTPGVHLHDARAAVMLPAFADDAVHFRDGHAYDGVHVNGRGALHWGQSLATLIETLVPPRAGVLAQSRTQIAASGRRQIAINPIFAEPDGGDLTGGATGAVPRGWRAEHSGGAGSVACSVATDARGVGSTVTIDFAATAAGEAITLSQTIAAGAWAPDDVLEAFADVELTGTPIGLGGIHLHLLHNSGEGGSSRDVMDMFGPQQPGHVGPDRPVAMTLRTRPYRVAPTVGVFPYVVAMLRAWAAAPGQSSIVVRQIGVRRRDGV